MKKISRRSFVKAAGTVLALTALTACGGSASSTAASGSTASSAASGSAAASSEALSADVQAIVDRGVLKVGVKNAVKGFSFQDTLTGEYTGLEDSLAEMIAEHLGVDVEFTTVTAATRGELLDSGDIDCVLATFTITEERRKSWDFSTPYYTDYVSVLVEDASGIKELADLKDKVVGVSSGSTSARALVQAMIEAGVISGDGFDADTFNADTGRSTELLKYLVKNKDGYVLQELRRANKNFYYAMAQSNLVNGLTREMVVQNFVPWWQYAMLGINIALGAFTALFAVLFVFSIAAGKKGRKA